MSSVNNQRRSRTRRTTISVALCLLGMFVFGRLTYVYHHTVTRSTSTLTANSASFLTFARLGLDQHLQQHCVHLQDDYEQLLNNLFQPWNGSGFDVELLERTSGERVYVYNGKLLLSDSTEWARTIPTFVRYIQHISKLVDLPNMILPLNPADEPLAALKIGERPRPLLAFCKVPGFSDVLIPNTAEGSASTLIIHLC